MSHVITITGRAQHGKDTVGQYLINNYGYHKVSLAQPLKDFIYMQNPLVPKVFTPDNPNYQNEVFSIGTNYELIPLKEAVDDYGWDLLKLNPYFRTLLQKTGTEAGRNIIGDDVWIKAAQNTIDTKYAHQRVVITDVRFPNEAQWSQGKDDFLKVVRPGYENHSINMNHDSEKFIDDLVANETIYNDGSLQDLYDKVDARMRQLNVSKI